MGSLTVSRTLVEPNLPSNNDAYRGCSLCQKEQRTALMRNRNPDDRQNYKDLRLVSQPIVLDLTSD